MPHQNIIVTGANRGIGLEFVRQLLNTSPAPKHLIATARNECAQLDEFKCQHSNLHILTYDATKYDNYCEFVDKVQQIVGDDGVDLLVNNAGLLIENDLQSVTPHDMVTNFEVNAVAPLTLTQSLLPLLRQSSCSGRLTVIANISSLTGSISGYALGWGYSYATSKAALNMISKALALDLRADGIIVLALRPGWVQTDMGGEEADLTPQTSVGGMMKVIEHADSTKSGTFISWEGVEQQW